MSAPWFLGGLLLPLAQQIRGHECFRRQALKELDAENDRLKRLLADVLLENEVTKEALRIMW